MSKDNCDSKKAMCDLLSKWVKEYQNARINHIADSAKRNQVLFESVSVLNTFSSEMKVFTDYRLPDLFIVPLSAMNPFLIRNYNEGKSYKLNENEYMRLMAVKQELTHAFSILGIDAENTGNIHPSIVDPVDRTLHALASYFAYHFLEEVHRAIKRRNDGFVERNKK